MRVNMNFDPADKALIEGEKYHSYSYHEFTEDSLRTLAAKPIQEIPGSEMYALVQMLYPHNLICSGLFDHCLVFDIVDGKRNDPPKEYWHDLASKGSDGILLDRIITALEENGVRVHESWKEALNRSKEAQE
jgi:hypothetical protein